jgi:hypothetical protein
MFGFPVMALGTPQRTQSPTPSFGKQKTEVSDTVARAAVKDTVHFGMENPHVRYTAHHQPSGFRPPVGGGGSDPPKQPDRSGAKKPEDKSDESDSNGSNASFRRRFRTALTEDKDVTGKSVLIKMEKDKNKKFKKEKREKLLRYARRIKYDQTEKGKKTNRKAEDKYKPSPAGKKTQKKYNDKVRGNAFADQFIDYPSSSESQTEHQSKKRRDKS